MAPVNNDSSTQRSMHFSYYSSKTSEQILQELHVTASGLPLHEAETRLQKYGKNVLSGKETHWYDVFFNQFKSPFLYLLIFAAILSFLFKEFLNGVMILLFVTINALLGFYQEYKSEKTLKLLKQYIVSKTKVLRENIKELVTSDQLVVGDIVILEPGDILSADIRFITTQNLFVDESVLTGETVSVNKIAEKLTLDVKETYQARNIGFSGTSVISGKATGVVINTGRNTVMGEITSLTVETKHTSSFEKSISKLSTFILKTISITLILIVVANLLIKGTHINFPTLIIFAIALAISVIPEALPVVTTFCLSRGALHLARHKVIVKRLSAIEDLGSIEILCTDKTGTITENKLTVSEVFPAHSKALLYASLATSLTNQKNAATDPFDTVLLKTLSPDEKKLFSDYKRIEEVPFDPERKRNSVLIKKDHYELIVRGAAETILGLCIDLHTEKKKELRAWYIAQGSEGKRVIAVAKRTVLTTAAKELEVQEKGLEIIGLISFIDPLKKTAHEAIITAEKLGVKIKILTGDSKEVAGSVAYTVGLIPHQAEVITGEEFDALSTEKQHAAVTNFSVFARVSPEQKYKVIKLLQEQFEVGFLGDGINDAPALKVANMAIVVQGATDIARDAADIILLNKSLHTIVDGIKEGREIFTNTAKYIKATLASNFGNFYTVAIASLFIPFLPLLPLQILLINLLTDFPMIAVATDNVDAEELKRPRSYDIKEIALFAICMGVVSTLFDFLFFLLFYRISPQVLQTNWFIGSVLTELVFLFSIRTRLPVLKANKPSGILFWLSTAAFITGIILPFTQIGHRVFQFITPSIQQMYLIIVITIAYFFTTEVVKLSYYRFIVVKKQ